MDEVGARLGIVTTPSAHAEIWFAWVGEHAAHIERFSREYLSSDEDTRRREYRSRASAERYVVTRSLVRIVLSQHLGIPSRSIRVSQTEAGKPVIAQGVHFNVSHSGQLVLLAVSDDRPVGVDVERRRTVSRVNLLVARWLTPAEREDLIRLIERGIEQSDAFLQVWSQKEARLKALGVGISGASTAELDRVEVVAMDRWLSIIPKHHDDAGYVGALAFA